MMEFLVKLALVWYLMPLFILIGLLGIIAICVAAIISINFFMNIFVKLRQQGAKE